MTDTHELIENARRDVLLGDYVSALTVLSELLRVRPDNVDALLLKGNALEVQAYAESNVDDMSFENCPLLSEAKACYEMILARAPGNAEALRDLANLHKDAGHLEKAMNLLHRALSAHEHRKPQGAEALLGIKSEIEELKRLIG
ncbi:tetratricopeptide repeat protein [Variovorax sp. YR750]|uniref:tetratricopeptide repeat protein n=1 Tax=Variovorax sp. YR750 TaxID=1884384 RepID=UPI000B840174|nr:tetratricopeptide repeat protein [Variovorax sp. YR750]